MLDPVVACLKHIPQPKEDLLRPLHRLNKTKPTTPTAAPLLYPPPSCVLALLFHASNYAKLFLSKSVQPRVLLDLPCRLDHLHVERTAAVGKSALDANVELDLAALGELGLLRHQHVTLPKHKQLPSFLLSLLLLLLLRSTTAIADSAGIASGVSRHRCGGFIFFPSSVSRCFQCCYRYPDRTFSLPSSHRPHVAFNNTFQAGPIEDILEYDSSRRQDLKPCSRESPPSLLYKELHLFAHAHSLRALRQRKEQVAFTLSAAQKAKRVFD
jgi:hypothetical protein